MDSQLHALEASAARLQRLVQPLGPAELEAPAYPREWSIADVMSHLGSGAVIMQRRLEDGLAGNDMPDDFAPKVWDVWNAKSASDKAADGLAADRESVARFGSLTDDERARLAVKMGPLTLDATALVSFRLNEHALHTWDIEVAREHDARLHHEAVGLVIDHLELIGRFTARPDGGAPRRISVQTTGPERHFAIEIGADAVTFSTGTTPASPAGGENRAADLALPAEAFIRLVYGRLDPDHTPEFEGDEPTLDRLRKVFPGP